MPEPCFEPGCRQHTQPVHRSATGSFFSPSTQGVVQRDPLPPVPRYELTSPTLSTGRPSWRDRIRLLPEAGLHLDMDLLRRIRLTFMPESFFSLYDYYPIPRTMAAQSPALAPSTSGGTGGTGQAEQPPPSSRLPSSEPTTRPGTMGDVLRAVSGLPAVSQLQQRVTARLERDWHRLTLGEQILVGTTLGVIGGGAGTGMYLGDANSRRLLFQGLRAVEVPVPGVEGLRFQLQTTDDSINGILFRYGGRF